jgi:hypothetical protein
MTSSKMEKCMHRPLGIFISAFLVTCFWSLTAAAASSYVCDKEPQLCLEVFCPFPGHGNPLKKFIRDQESKVFLVSVLGLEGEPKNKALIGYPTAEWGHPNISRYQFFNGEGRSLSKAGHCPFYVELPMGPDAQVGYYIFDESKLGDEIKDLATFKRRTIVRDENGKEGRVVGAFTNGTVMVEYDDPTARHRIRFETWLHKDLSVIKIAEPMTREAELAAGVARLKLLELERQQRWESERQRRMDMGSTLVSSAATPGAISDGASSSSLYGLSSSKSSSSSSSSSSSPALSSADAAP